MRPEIKVNLLMVSVNYMNKELKKEKKIKIPSYLDCSNLANTCPGIHINQKLAAVLPSSERFQNIRELLLKISNFLVRKTGDANGDCV